MSNEQQNLNENGTGIAGAAAKLFGWKSKTMVKAMMKDPKFQAAAKKAADARREQEQLLDDMFGTTDPARVEKAALEYSKNNDARKMHAGEFIKGLAKYSRENA